MMGRYWLLCSLCWAQQAVAAPWAFDKPVTVSEDPAGKSFYHLESAGRKNIAVSAGWVAIAWEDNRDGQPRCYVALKRPGAAEFGTAQLISGSAEAFEPAMVGLGAGRFAVAWEEAGRVQVRVLDESGLTPPLMLSRQAANQISLAYASAGLYAVWSEQQAATRRIRAGLLVLRPQGTLQLKRVVNVEAGRIIADQAYPSVAVVETHAVFVAWEDRRAGHTRILVARSSNAGRQFSTPAQLNDSTWGGRASGYGRGTGAMRVALAAQGKRGVAAVWADKRDFLSGYDVYAALTDAPDRPFGVNEKVQDVFGNAIAQWHPAIAAQRDGQMAVAWDDDRDGTPDIWLSWKTGQGWSDDLPVPGASGPGVQSDPSLILDETGDLHLAWIEKDGLNSPSRIRYVLGKSGYSAGSSRR